MSKITSVEPQKILRLRSGPRFNIFIDNNFAFGADEDLVVNYRLVPGKELEKSLLEKLLFEAEVGKLMGRMYGLFSVRARSEGEIRRYLKNLSFKKKIKGLSEISEASIDLTIEKLKQKGLISDIDFARSWVDSRRRSKQKGKIALKQELMQKGIDREVIEEVISVYSGEGGDSEEKLATQALEKKSKSWKNLPEIEFKKKASEFLLRRGFEYSVVKDLIKKMTKSN